jgi:uncharacterized membrane protein YdbT with pleckstrin-like domain
VDGAKGSQPTELISLERFHPKAHSQFNQVVVVVVVVIVVIVVVVVVFWGGSKVIVTRGNHWGRGRVRADLCHPTPGAGQ